ncbi:hypothetical protein SAMN05421741_11011 [Paenimyroides ummariense]|uniref:Uncharacterized protein n=1 Tax=Paenimyroides ummariense TaxID=913024 RepID=A0A1I5BHL1_9FLAO|nr:hypothetical protein [Paenimyroides ummariense]SFN74225.1 hypothetical protein SAMN05421741_11011 [Paenimyroides ummariense]
MLKIFNISTLLLFVCFLFAPTITYALNKDVVNSSLIINEEEEVPTKTKSKANNNNINEEEEKEVHYHFFLNCHKIVSNAVIANSNLNFSKHTIKDNLVFKIPLPPPEQNL